MAGADIRELEDNSPYELDDYASVKSVFLDPAGSTASESLGENSLGLGGPKSLQKANRTKQRLSSIALNPWMQVACGIALLGIAWLAFQFWDARQTARINAEFLATNPASATDGAESAAKERWPACDRLPGRIKSLTNEIRENKDSQFDVTPVVEHMVQRIRTLAVLCDLQFNESTLGHCNQDATTVLFRRPEASYWIDVQTTQDKRFDGFLYPDHSSFCLYTEGSEPVQLQAEKDVTSAIEAFQRGSLAAAMVMEPDPELQPAVRSAAFKLLDSPEVTRVLATALAGKDMNMQFSCGPLECQIAWLPINVVTVRFHRRL